MIFLILLCLAALAAVIVFCIFFADWDDPVDWMLNIIMIPLFTIAGVLPFLLLGGLGFAIAQATAPTHPVMSESKPLVALGNDTRVSGGGGFVYVRVSEDNAYNFMSEVPGGGLSMTSIEADKALVMEDAAPQTATVETYSWEFDNGLLHAFYGRTGTTHTLHVPEGTVRRDFIVDVNK